MNSIYNKEFVVYLLSDRKKNTITGIIECGPELQSDLKSNYKTLVYFDKYRDRKKAVRKKRTLLKMENKDRIMYVKKKNPEWLNLIFTLQEYLKNSIT